MIKVTLICERCDVNFKKNIDLENSTIVFRIEEISKFGIFDLGGKLYLLCPDCNEKLGVIFNKNSEENDRRIRAFLHQET